MQNQFIYTRKELGAHKDGETPPVETFRDSFNVNKVIRTLQIEDNKLLVLLDDIHERAQMVPEIDYKTNKMKGYKRERNTVQTEITLEPEDAERFLKMFGM